ncbi:MAG TPA: protein translocase subunit SecD, partial [Gammaproteobacteria bacterium]|nr:protein translocase subunit SecD [Gammaproteobacteria bacterium]
MNRYPLWKYLLVLVVVLVGLVYALPNIYGDSPAVQIRARTAALDETLTQQVKEVLEEARIESFTVYLEQETLVLRFEQLEDQLRAKDALSIA